MDAGNIQPRHVSDVTKVIQLPWVTLCFAETKVLNFSLRSKSET